MMALSLSIPLHAQVNEVADIHGAGQIMRLTADSSDRVIYVENAQGVASFVFVSTIGVMSFNLPSGMHVNDFEIDGQYLYFCGHRGPHGLVGGFNVKKVFYWGVGINYVVCNLTTSDDGSTIHLSNFTKLDINHTATGTGLALIGEGVIDPQYHLSRTIPTSVEFLANQWRFTYFYNKDGTIHYTDIACLDNVVTAVGYLEASPDMCVVRSFRQVGNFPTQFLGGQQGHYIDPLKMYGDPHILRLKPDYAAIVHLLDDSRIAILQTVVNSTTGQPSAARPTFIVGTPMSVPQSQCSIYDVRFADSPQDLWILGNCDPIGGGTVINALLRATMFNASITVDVYTFRDVQQITHDIHKTLHVPMTAGYKLGTTQELLYSDAMVQPAPPCYDEYQAQPQTSTPVYKAVMSNPDAPRVDYTPWETAVDIIEHESFEVCP